jgi:hypothetical protein
VTNRHPSEYYSDLTEERLRLIAERLLDVRYETLQDMQSPYDDNYTRESAVYGRQRQMLIQIILSGEFEWLSLSHAGMDVTFKIGSVPCRFFTDDPSCPGKSGFFRRNFTDNLFEVEDQHPIIWRFVIEKAFSDESEDSMYLLGFNALHEKICEWMYRPSTPMLPPSAKETPPSIPIAPAQVGLKNASTNSAHGDKAA